MKSERLIKQTSILGAAYVILFGWTQPAVAAGPVAVAPGQSAEVAMTETASPLKFTFGVGAGYLTGESNEIVFLPDAGNHKVSELTWEIDNLFMVGIGAQMKFKNVLSLNFDGWFKAVDGEGTMDDFDFRIVGQDWTDWSHHEDTDVTKASILDFNAEFAVYRTEVVAFNLIGGYKRDNFGWEAHGGDFIFSVNNFRDTTGSFADGAAVISYEQTLSSLYFGMGITATFDRFDLAGRMIYSPFVRGEATDNHFLRNLVTFDETNDGDLIAFDISGSYLITNNFSVLMAYGFQKYDTMQGDSVWQFRDEGVELTFIDGAGMDQTSSLFSLSLQYTF